MSDTPFNPLDKQHLAESLAEAMLRKPVSPLPPAQKFNGAGIYAVYYSGDFAAYRTLAEKNRKKDPQSPIYVGKAVPPGARKGGFGLGVDQRTTALFRRLNEHARSIEEAENLRLSDFCCRFLVCDDVWIPLGEALLIFRSKPPWNVLIEGFGIHTPGKGRKKQVRSMWDTLHPGRALARGLPPGPMSQEKIQQLIKNFFAGKKVQTMSPAEAIRKEEEEQE